MYINPKIIVLFSIIMKGFTFFINKFDKVSLTQVKPQTIDELTTALCSTIVGKQCVDEDPKLIIIERIFNFVGTEGSTTEVGCWHLSSPECYLKGQQQLNINNQCTGLEPVSVTYDTAGRNPLIVGSNKYILGVGPNKAGTIGKGFYLYSVSNVIIQNISIVDINPRVIWGGDAVTMDNVTNVLIDGNIIQRIGRQMIVTGFGSCQNVTISNNIFNGSTPYSAYCNGRHYWTLLFLGKDDIITLYSNTVTEVSGRFPHMTGLKNSSVLLHMIENTFYNTDPTGGIEVVDATGRLLAEGNIFRNVPVIFLKNKGSVFFPQTQVECDECTPYIGRPCEINIITNSSRNNVTNDFRVLNDFKPYASVLIKPINPGAITI